MVMGMRNLMHSHIYKEWTQHEIGSKDAVYTLVMGKSSMDIVGQGRIDPHMFTDSLMKYCEWAFAMFHYNRKPIYKPNFHALYYF